jgi:hypothetical protein
MIKDEGPTATCDGCGAQHFLTKHVHGFRRYKNVDLCVDCYEIPQIQQATSAEWARLAIMDIQMGKTACAICTADLAIMGSAGAAFRREYVDVLEERCTVWTAVKSGAPWDFIRAANVRSRNLCMRCHSAVSISKKCTSIQRLKKIQVSDRIKQMAKSKVETLVHLLIFQGSDNS